MENVIRCKGGISESIRISMSVLKMGNMSYLVIKELKRNRSHRSEGVRFRVQLLYPFVLVRMDDPCMKQFLRHDDVNLPLDYQGKQPSGIPTQIEENKWRYGPNTTER